MNHTVFFMGMAVLQVVFITYQFILFRRQEYIYYIVYSVLMSLFVFFKSFPEANPLSIFVTPQENFTAGRSLLVLAYGMYLLFGRHFTEVKQYHRSLNRQLRYVERFFVGYALTDLTLLLAGLDYIYFELPTQLLFLASIPYFSYVIFCLLKGRRKLTNIFVVGSGMLLLFGSFGFIDQTYLSKGAKTVNDYMAYLEVGITLEFLFLNYGLIYKTRMIQRENMRLEVEKQVELYKQRMRISHDLHDEVGATLSGIALYSQLTKHQIQTQKTDLVEQSLDRMQQSATEMVDKLSDIVWAVNPDQDSLQQLWSKIDDYAKELAAAKGMEVESEFPASLPEIKLTMDTRRNTYLFLKEAINNAVKYSSGTVLQVGVAVHEEELSFLVADNGKGFDEATVKKGNGLTTLEHRARELEATYLLTSLPGKGTRINLRYKLPQ